jgi:hypothetical protein
LGGTAPRVAPHHQTGPIAMTGHGQPAVSAPTPAV